jgi:hypothetical protein
VIASLHVVAYADTGDDVNLPSGLDVLDQTVPLSVYAAVWAVAAACAFLGAFVDRHGHQRDALDAWGFGLVAGVLTIWSGTYLIGWAGDPSSRQWVFGGIYLCIAVLTTSAARMTNPGTARTGDDT